MRSKKEPPTVTVSLKERSFSRVMSEISSMAYHAEIKLVWIIVNEGKARADVVIADRRVDERNPKITTKDQEILT